MKIRINNVHIDAAVVVVDDKTATIKADSDIVLDFSHLPKIQRDLAILKAETVLQGCLMGKYPEADLSGVFQAYVLKDLKGEGVSECTLPVHVYPTT